MKDELGYFNTSIAVHDKYNIDKALQSGGVKPLEDRSYALGDIKGAAEHRLGGKTMQFRCVKDKNVSLVENNVFQLFVFRRIGSWRTCGCASTSS